MWVRAAIACCLGLTLPAPQAQTFDLPSIDRIVNYQPKLPLQVLTADGVEIAQFGEERREYVPLARTPKLLQDAVLAVEDARFREHPGIDLQGMARAALAPLLGRRLHGASTITQQLVRTMLLTREFSVERKAKEILLALRVEQALSKDRILEIYLNEIYLGARAYGFASAARTYFGKSMDQLTLAETALLAGLPQNPHYANPVTNMSRAITRQHWVLARMVAVGVISEAQASQAKAEKIVLRNNAARTVSAGHVAEMARLAVVERLGNQAYTAGIRVVTSLRASDQRAATEAVQRGLLALERRSPYRGPEAQENLPNLSGEALERAAALALKDHRDDDVLRVGIVLTASTRQVDVQLASGQRVSLSGEGLRWAQPALAANAKAPLKIERGSVVRVMSSGEGASTTWAIAQWPQAEAALAAIDTRTGRVRALVGGFDFARQPFNNATQGFRQPGSAFKPFVYSAAFEERVMPGSLVDDLPFVAANGWSPSNSYNDFMGPMNLRDAMARSSNIVSIRLTQHATPQRVRDWSARFGLDAMRQPDNLTLALGTGAATPLQMARAYAVFANGGWRVNPVVIERITDAAGKVLFEAPPPEAFTDDNRAISARNAWLTTSLLGEVTQRGTAARVNASLKRTDLYGKTGTTDEAVDAWFVGYHPTLSVAVWMGHPKPKSMGDRESGSRLALPVWIDFMSVALRGVPVQALTEPPAGITRGDSDWLYTEWAQGGWIMRITADMGSVMAPTVLPVENPPPTTPTVEPKITQ